MRTRIFRLLAQRPSTCQHGAIAGVTQTFTISLPFEMAAKLEQVRKVERRTRSELIREALRQYFTRKDRTLRRAYRRR
jgi:Arc/MetJ-type ribon-helix-helix transcriptional regulator